MQISALPKQFARMTQAKKISLGMAAAGAAVVAGSLAGAPAASAATPAQSSSGSVSRWINESLTIMRAQGIPGSYNGIHRNLMRESSGNPNAINNWDSNAAKGIPSKGLLQVIDPTFRAYHVPGTSWNIYDPVANITAACNYAAHRYGSIDNVNSAY
ncbi:MULTISPECIES: transglycosylase SLT domain-containing protein [unclassified Streptomyces]|uniref:transglycosylase SLT domain-containing protein n=1 Tax=unclassified Streptomyces TaxID=2593676 RepID=UPI0022504998|nr:MULTISPECIES: transglycosylase SLT domain-containing protein [unclassified Streptomyces]WSP55155.1 transglycosylase SLT domain-containing protein [Streptomyces sp. NBC_01241]WSU24121.1 transglycosylase SLT domain-containing protein [Streptomyces sp. NBC_01108]MCX4786819.1 transglycosylase SLT domain-containing protein [Streptomyces sp. NBC_01221]MCX4797412.1 transglycosylase SLT domain-containing protein [Streptomyces sp. NBC_01242]WSJ38696.1 transglycosylase SLT domain-containing protein [